MFEPCRRWSVDQEQQVPEAKTQHLSKAVSKHKSPLKQRLNKYFLVDVCEDTLLESELLLLAFATGIQDATTFPDYHCFASNQTGNTVLLAVGVAGISGNVFSLRNIGVSLAIFVAGGWITGFIGNWLGCRRRWWLIVSSLAQTVMVFAASALQYRIGAAEDNESGALGIIALLAFSSGAQVAMARALQLTEITTAMATAAYVDLFIDANLLGWDNRSRNRRVLFLLSLFAGSFAGAFAYARVGSAFSLLISAVGKLLVTFAFILNKEIKEAE